MTSGNKSSPHKAYDAGLAREGCLAELSSSRASYCQPGAGPHLHLRMWPSHNEGASCKGAINVAAVDLDVPNWQLVVYVRTHGSNTAGCQLARTGQPAARYSWHDWRVCAELSAWLALDKMSMKKETPRPGRVWERQHVHAQLQVSATLQVTEYLGAGARQFGFMLRGLKLLEPKLKQLNIPFFLLKVCLPRLRHLTRAQSKKDICFQPAALGSFHIYWQCHPPPHIALHR